MNAVLVELEGSWEEILARASEWVGRRVRLTVLPEESEGLAPRGDHRDSFWESPGPAALFDEQGIGPVEDVDAFIASLPRPRDAQDLWDAVAADRADRRAEDTPRC